MEPSLTRVPPEQAVRKPLGTEQQPRQYLTFMLGAEVYAIGILAVKEIIEHPDLTDVPMMPAHIRGVFNLRGAAVPVIDPAVHFGRPRSQRARRSCVVIIEAVLESERQVGGILVDGVNSVVELPDSDIEPPPSCGGPVRAGFIQGIAKINGRFVILLNAQRMLAGNGSDVALDETSAAAA